MRATATMPATVGLIAEDIDDAREQAAAVADLRTPLEAAGLPPRADSVAASLGASMVGALLDVPRTRSPMRAERGTRSARRSTAATASGRTTFASVPSQTPGDRVGPPPRKPWRRWRHCGGAAHAPRSTEGARRTKPRPDAVRATLHWPGGARLGEWPVQTAIAKALGISQNTVSTHQLAAVER